ncbi:MAG: SGNH/GDSL hydrolase family protein [Vicingaceae bacterium]
MKLFRLLFKVLFAELLLRLILWINIFPVNVDRYITETLDWHQKGQMEMVNQSASYVRMRPNVSFQELNSHGFHSPEIGLKKTGKYRIAFIGGSTTYDKGPIDETYPYFVSKNLNELGLSNEFLNAGTSGYTSTESLIAYHLRVEPFKPDMLVLYNGRNDMMSSGNKSYDVNDLTKRFHPPSIVAPSNTHQRMSKASCLYALGSEVVGFNSLRINNWSIRSRFDPFFREAIGVAETMDDYVNNIQNSQSELAYKRNIEALTALTKINHTALVLIGFDYNKENPVSSSLPTDRVMRDDEKEILNAKIALYNSILSDIAKQHSHVSFYNLSGKIDRRHFIDDCHLSKEGKKEKGELIAAFISEIRPELALNN